MASMGILIIIVGVFFAGIGIGYAVFPSSIPTNSMMSPQQMKQMINYPDQMFQWHHAMMNDSQVIDIWMDTILSEPKLRQQMINKISQETTEELQELEELTSQQEKNGLRVELLKQMEVQNQDLASLAPFYTDDPNLNDMMTEKMVEHNHLMNQLLNQVTIVSELDESIKKHMEEHQQLAEQIASFNQNG